MLFYGKEKINFFPVFFKLDYSQSEVAADARRRA